MSLLLHLNETDPVVTDVRSVQLFYGYNFVKYACCMAVFHMLIGYCKLHNALQTVHV